MIGNNVTTNFFLPQIIWFSAQVAYIRLSEMPVQAFYIDDSMRFLIS